MLKEEHVRKRNEGYRKFVKDFDESKFWVLMSYFAVRLKDRALLQGLFETLKAFMMIHISKTYYKNELAKQKKVIIQKEKDLEESKRESDELRKVSKS